MSVVINTNIPSITAARHFASARAGASNSSQKLASGSRINTAADDAAGLTVASKMRAQVASTSQAIRNINDAISMAHVYPTQAATGSYSADDCINMQQEYYALTYEELLRIRETTNFNRLDVTQHNFTTKIQMGERVDDTLTIEFPGMGRHVMGLNAGNLETVSGARDAIVATDTGLASMAERKSKIGAFITRLEYASRNLLNVDQLTSSALSTIADTDFAMETASLARFGVLTQAASAMLAQSNQAPEYVLSLLRT
ncbi:MAG: hypothetical protein LW820_00710 [Acidibacter sp.]|nr:hypothetical protein [Acidibacter sp.]